LAFVIFAGVIAGVFLFFWFAEPLKWTAAIEDCKVEASPVSVEEYLARRYSPDIARQKREHYSANRLSALGRVVSYRVHFVGRPKERYTLFFQMFDALNHHRIRIEDDEDEPFDTLYQDAADDEFAGFWWFEPGKAVNDPTLELLVRLEVRNKRHNQPMTDCTTPAFSLK
jgi:hypothetical protein